jgi:hypothetical protein
MTAAETEPHPTAFEAWYRGRYVVKDSTFEGYAFEGRHIYLNHRVQACFEAYCAGRSAPVEITPDIIKRVLDLPIEALEAVALPEPMTLKDYLRAAVIPKAKVAGR